MKKKIGKSILIAGACALCLWVAASNGYITMDHKMAVRQVHTRPFNYYYPYSFRYYYPQLKTHVHTCRFIYSNGTYIYKCD